MEGSRQLSQAPAAARHFREQSEAAPRPRIESATLTAEAPFEVNMTDEPGGDPYNHTGRFRRNFR
jgi:hypothetical protein